jgi:hypothetical protein
LLGEKLENMLEDVLVELELVMLEDTVSDGHGEDSD